MAIWEPIYKSASCIKKVERPILTKEDLPYEATLVFNAGVAKVGERYVMVFRNDYGTDEQKYREEHQRFTSTSVGIAVSDNGIDGWRVMERPILDFNRCSEPCNLLGTEDRPYATRLYDPRITVIEGEVYLCLAMDTHYGLRGCIAKLSDDLERYEIISASVPDNRNMVLFPEKIGGYYCRLERPFRAYGKNKDRYDIWISRSPDLRFWGESSLLLRADQVPFSNDKIGPAAPPVKTKYGWLTTFHAVDKQEEGRGQTEWEVWWNKRYCGGIMLLDLEDPAKIIGMCKTPLIAPELPHETDHGYRQNVIFPGGMILEENGEVKIYYGSADTVECVATADVEELVALCTEQP